MLGLPIYLSSYLFMENLPSVTPGCFTGHHFPRITVWLIFILWTAQRPLHWVPHNFSWPCTASANGHFPPSILQPDVPTVNTSPAGALSKPQLLMSTLRGRAQFKKNYIKQLLPFWEVTQIVHYEQHLPPGSPYEKQKYGLCKAYFLKALLCREEGSVEVKKTA